MMQLAPNILFLFPDQWRHDWTGFNGALDVRTPNLTRLAALGTRCTDAASPSPVCAPARACLALGLEFARCPVKWNSDDLPLEATTVYRRLRDAGYHTMGCGKFDLHKNSYRWGEDGRTDLEAWGFADGTDNEGKIDAFLSDAKGQRGPYMAMLEARGLREAHHADHRARGQHGTLPTPLPEDAYCDNWIGERGLDLIAGAPAGRPWFLQVNFTGPHSPWDVTEGMWQSVRGRAFPGPVHAGGVGGAGDEKDAGKGSGGKPGDPDHLEIRRMYVAMLENLDRWVGRYLDLLEARGELANTLVVFASDHGEMLGDHGAWGKVTWRHASLNVPLIMAGPGVRAGAVRREPTALLDVAATFLDAAGLPVPAEMDARSLMPMLGGDGDGACGREVVTAALRNWRVAMDARWKLVAVGEQRLLFDRVADPEEVTDVAAAHPEVVAALERHLQV